VTIEATATDYFAAQQAVFDHCGYVEDWVIIPMIDCRNSYWAVDAAECEWCLHAPTPDAVEAALLAASSVGGNPDALKLPAIEALPDYYLDAIYTQRFLKRWVYRGSELAIVCCDPRVDGNRFLRLFLTSTEIRRPSTGVGVA
jgi:hypothetical protein